MTTTCLAQAPQPPQPSGAAASVPIETLRPEHKFLSKRAEVVVKLANFVEWPRRTFSSPEAPLVIGVFGHGPTIQAFDRTAREMQAQGRPVVIRRMEPGMDLKDIHILYVPGPMWERAKNRPSMMGKSSVLTVSDGRGFAQSGGIIGINRVGGDGFTFEINEAGARRAGLSFRCTLLGVGGTQVVREHSARSNSPEFRK